MMLFQDIWRSMVRKNKKKKEDTEQGKAKCAFQIAVENTPDVKNGFRAGLQAVKNSDRNKVDATDPKKYKAALTLMGKSRKYILMIIVGTMPCRMMIRYISLRCILPQRLKLMLSLRN